jgi:hypothetical protein
MIVCANGLTVLKFMMMKLKPSSMSLVNAIKRLLSVRTVLTLTNANLTALVLVVPLTVDTRNVGLMVVVEFVACALILIPATTALVNLQRLQHKLPVNLNVLLENVGLMDVVVLVTVLMGQPALMALAQHLRLQSVYPNALQIHVVLMAVVMIVLVLTAVPVAMANVLLLPQPPLLMLEQTPPLLLLLILAYFFRKTRDPINKVL